MKISTTPITTTLILNTPQFLQAASSGQISVVTKYLKAGFDINRVCPKTGSSALILACIFEQKAMVDYLLSCGANPIIENKQLLTPTLITCFTGNSHILAKLLEHYVGLAGLANSFGTTPLMAAVASDHYFIALNLLHLGINPLAVDERGKTALDVAQANGNPLMIKLLKKTIATFPNEQLIQPDVQNVLHSLRV